MVVEPVDYAPPLLEIVQVEEHPVHGNFEVEVPEGWEDTQIKEYVGTLDLDLLLGLPKREDAKEGKVKVDTLKILENSLNSGYRVDPKTKIGLWHARPTIEKEGMEIGYGEKLTPLEIETGRIKIDGKDVDFRQGITTEQAESLLAASTSHARGIALASLAKVGLEGSDSKVSALTSLIFNVGMGAWGKSKAKAFLEAGNVEDFLHEAFDSKVGFVRINGEISRGLVRRRGDEARLFASEDVVKEGGFGDMLRQVLKAINPIGSAEAHTFDPTQAQGGAVPLGNNNYKVASGDTLAGIAKKFGTTVEQLVDLNSDITDPNKIAVGQEILLMPPGGAPATPEPKPVRSPPATPITAATFNTDTGVFDLFDADPTQTVEPSSSSSIPEPPLRLTPDLTKEEITAFFERAGVSSTKIVEDALPTPKEALPALGVERKTAATPAQVIQEIAQPLREEDNLSAVPTPSRLLITSNLPFAERITFGDADVDLGSRKIMFGVTKEADKLGISFTTYEMYPPLKNGLSVKALVGDATKWDAAKKDYVRDSKGEVKYFADVRAKLAAERAKFYPKGVAGKAKLLFDMTHDPVLRAAYTVGRFSIQSDGKGNRYVAERWNFNSASQSSGDAVSEIRKFFSTLGTASVGEGEGPLVAILLDGSLTTEQIEDLYRGGTGSISNNEDFLSVGS